MIQFMRRSRTQTDGYTRYNDEAQDNLIVDMLRRYPYPRVYWIAGVSLTHYFTFYKSSGRSAIIQTAYSGLAILHKRSPLAVLSSLAS